MNANGLGLHARALLCKGSCAVASRRIYFIYMTTQVIFKIDPVLKKKAQKKAAQDGVTFSDVLQSATRSYIEGDYELKFRPKMKEFAPTKRELAELKKARADYKAGKYELWSDVKDELDRLHKIKR